MRLLTLVRHAKSSWEQAGLPDFDRSLNERGRRDAPVMAARLRHAVERPDLLVSSPALRAITTARVFAQTFGIPADEIQLHSKIYEASADTLLRIVRDLGDPYRHVALFGHNPGLSQLAQLLARCDFDDLPTCGIAHFSFAAKTWQDLTPGGGVLLQSIWPKDGRAS